MKQLWWKIKMYLFTLLSTWLTPMNNIITLHKFKVITSINCLWPIGQVHLQISGLLRWLSGKETVCQCKRRRRHGFSPWVEKIPWSWKWQPTPGFLPGKSHGQRSLGRATVHGAAKSQIWQKRVRMHSQPEYMITWQLAVEQGVKERLVLKEEKGRRKGSLRESSWEKPLTRGTIIDIHTL